MTKEGKKGKKGTPPGPSPYGHHFGTLKRSERSPRRCKIQAKIENRKKVIQEDQGPVLERSWSLWGAMWEPEDPKSIGKRNISCKITFSKIRRFEDGSGTNLGRPRLHNGRKRSPKRTQNRSPNNHKTTPKSTKF